MALEITHLRFAVDIKDYLDVHDISNYLAGTLYPDSRYITEIDREATHPGLDFFMEKKTALSDFEKGWFAHLLCDETQANIAMQAFPELHDLAPGQYGERWLKLTAVKYIQNISDMKIFDLTQYYSCFSRYSNPNGEEIKEIESYYSMLYSLYSTHRPISHNDILAMWENAGFGHELIGKIRNEIEVMLNDTIAMDKMTHLYGETLANAKKLLSNKSL